MIVDTSAVPSNEDDHEASLAALLGEPAILPAPARLEFLVVVRNPRFDFAVEAEALLDRLTRLGMETLAWDSSHAAIGADAQRRYGKGNGRGGLLDLMVYAVAKERNEPLLFARRDFAATDVIIHTASRLG